MLIGALNAHAESSALRALDLDILPSLSEYAALAAELKRLHEESPGDTDVALAYAEKLLQLGDVNEAEAVLAPLYTDDSSNPLTILLMARTAYLKGDYESAEALYDLLLAEYPAYKKAAEYGIQFVYYQTNQYQKAQRLSADGEGRTGVRSLMKAYGDKEPYRVTWDGVQETIIPFIVSDPLPIVELEMNGEKRYFVVDTGASDTYLNESVATALGLESVATQTAPYAGGIMVDTNYGIVDSLRLGSVTLENIPVNIANMDHLTGFAGDAFEISGVIGIGVFKQFLVTVDYLSSELMLKPRGEHLAVDPEAYEIPFILAECHFTLCKAVVNGKAINSWTDSGLDFDASLLLTDGAIEYLGISEIEAVDMGDDNGGLGGADFTIGSFTVDSYQMGGLPAVHDMKGLSGVITGSGYEDEPEFFLDAIISHQYLKEYAWTMDFDSMTMTFAK